MKEKINLLQHAEQHNDKVRVYSYDEYMSDDFKPPSKFFYVNALDNRVFLLTRNEGTAQKMIDEIEGTALKFRVRRVFRMVGR